MDFILYFTVKPIRTHENSYVYNTLDECFWYSPPKSKYPLIILSSKSTGPWSLELPSLCIWAALGSHMCDVNCFSLWMVECFKTQKKIFTKTINIVCCSDRTNHFRTEYSVWISLCIMSTSLCTAYPGKNNLDILF